MTMKRIVTFRLVLNGVYEVDEDELDGTEEDRAIEARDMAKEEVFRNVTCALSTIDFEVTGEWKAEGKANNES